MDFSQLAEMRLLLDDNFIKDSRMYFQKSETNGILRELEGLN